MNPDTRFRTVLPLLETVLAASFGGWGLFERNAILSRPFWGSTGWHTTAVFHVWPWPFKLAIILNMPVFLAGCFLPCWPLDFLGSAVPEWVCFLERLLLVPLFWYLLGSWADEKKRAAAK